ncbi:unnamed protein product, partial [Rhizoctonia solani]
MRHFNFLRVVRQNWFFFSTIILLGADIAGTVVFGRYLNKHRSVAMEYNGSDSVNYEPFRDFRMSAIIVSRCSVSLLNELFLMTYGFMYTNTIVGTFLFQQFVYHPIIILFTAVGCWFGRPFHPMGPILIEWSWLTLPLAIRGACDLLMTIVLWCLLFGTKDFKDRKPNCLSANIEELASGTRPIPRDIVTWRGVIRRRGMRSIRGRIHKSLSNLVYNSLFRRVIPVETPLQVLFQHLFSLMAIALLIARTATELQKAYENLPSRRLVEPCEQMSGFNPENNHTIFIRLPHLRGVLTSTQPDISAYVINVSATYQCNQGVSAPTISCTQAITSTLPDPSTYVDWYLTYQCPSIIRGGGGISARQNKCSLAGHQYTIEFLVPRSETNETLDGFPALKDRLPSIWLANSDAKRDILAPYLTPPMEPEPGWHTVFNTHFAQRKFITSSPLWDSIMGADPVGVNFHFSLNLANLNKLLNLGFDLFQTYETILFFPECAKIISPFGFAGQFATKAFKERLKERYRNSSKPEAVIIPGPSNAQAEVHLDMTQFLLDYVIDMGPASPSVRREEIDSENDSEEVEYTQVPSIESAELGPGEVRSEMRSNENTVTQIK